MPPGYSTGELWVGRRAPGKQSLRRKPVALSPGPTDFLLCVSSCGSVLPVRAQDPFLPYPPRSCPHATRDPAQR